MNLNLNKITTIISIVLLIMIAIFRNNVAVLIFSVFMIALMGYTAFRVRTKWNIATAVCLSVILVSWNVYLGLENL
ncbi:hypothetical protein [Paenibacillus tundrae]|uniref:Membrane-associated HD superfamily phosphohydrolase n=1 Tax=Paenibacillus tundrae TaxID=528187 RepID=A0ABT9WHH9_9BACL|nr:hypothetical protein [Paenibacillus tundrae]MDQ0172734.1 membrane-associated HD superfamily phosphohydrolase [Paenibacillus tundrae]